MREINSLAPGVFNRKKSQRTNELRVKSILPKKTSWKLKQEIAVMLFQNYKLTLGQASKLADMSQYQFQHLLASGKIPIHYGIEDERWKQNGTR